MNDPVNATDFTWTYRADGQAGSFAQPNGNTTALAYDAADRPTSGANPPATYTSDADGRLTAGPGYQYSWDRLGRLTTVTDGAGTTLATYTYDPLDRLRLVDDGGGTRTRFRYTGMTTAVAQWLDDATGTVTRSLANGWTGERLADWTGSGADLRIYGTNAHHDTTWLATSSGSVSAALRYDPWGNPRGPVPSGYTPFRFQGAWSDATTGLAWVVTRWYAPALGRFISEDSLLGTPADPPSRHLYAYAEGEPIGRWDPDGRSWCTRCTSSTLYLDADKKVWTKSIRNKLKARGQFRLAAFIRTKWVDAPFTNGLKGDWREFWPGWNCLQSRACIEVDFSNNLVTLVVQPTCERTGTSDWRYQCKDALDINAPWPLVNAISVIETGIGETTVQWSLNQSITWGFFPIDGRLKLTPPGAKDWYGRPITPKVRLSADGYPSLELWYRRSSYGPIYRDYEGTPTDLGPGYERNVTKSWPSW